MKNEDFTINELGDCYDLFLKKYPNLQIHLSIISENLKISKESHNLEIWYDKIIDYILMMIPKLNFNN